MQLFRYKRIWGVLLLPISLLIVLLASHNPAAVEALYSLHVYRWLSAAGGWLFSIVPFSVAECLLVLAVLSLLGYIVWQVVQLFRRGGRRQRVARLLASVLGLSGVVTFVFFAVCGLNYHRQSFAVHSGLAVRPSSVEELAVLCEELVVQANLLRPRLVENEQGRMVSGFASYSDAAQQARQAFARLGDDYVALSGYVPTPKPVALSRGMSHLNITGIYIPFTFEANVNTDVPDFWIPSTMTHELAHAKGFMREDEANFIAYLACMASENAEFQYSGTMLALSHCANALYAADREQFWMLSAQYGNGLVVDLATNSAYWKQFEGPVAEVSTAVNDIYLKSNNQVGGVKSYGRMVDLLLADYRQRKSAPFREESPQLIFISAETLALPREYATAFSS